MISRGWSRAFVIGAAALLISACSPSVEETGQERYLTSIDSIRPHAGRGGQPLQVLTSTSILADVVSQVAGEAAVVTSLVPVGVDPHAFQATPQDWRRLEQADVVFVHGLGLEAFLADMLTQAGGQVPILSVSEGLAPLPGHVAETDGSDYGEWDPHTWMDPNNTIVAVDIIQRALSQLVPEEAQAFEARATGYRADLAALDAELETMLEVIPDARRKLVTDHEDLAYFAHRYGLQIIGNVIPGTSSLAEPSARQLADLLDRIRSEQAPAIFVTASASSQIVEQFASDAGIEVVVLHSHSLTGPEGAAPDYLSLMRYNGQAIARALSP